LTGKPTYEELEDFVFRLKDIDCKEIHPNNCLNCILLFTGFCKETETLAGRLREEGS